MLPCHKETTWRRQLGLPTALCDPTAHMLTFRLRVQENVLREPPLGQDYVVVTGSTPLAGRPRKESRHSKWHDGPRSGASATKKRRKCKRARGQDLSGFSTAERAAEEAIPTHRYAHLSNFSTSDQRPVHVDSGYNQRRPLEGGTGIAEADAHWRRCCACYTPGAGLLERFTQIRGVCQFCARCRCIIHTAGQCNRVVSVPILGEEPATLLMCQHCHAKSTPHQVSATTADDLAGAYANDGRAEQEKGSQTKKQRRLNKCKHCGNLGHTARKNCPRQ